MPDSSCLFCAPPLERLFHLGELVVGMWDGFPVTEGHALLVPKRHVPTWFDATKEEQLALLDALEIARQKILETVSRVPEGFNIGINNGEVAGQTIPHLHVHLIPRYSGDVDDPRGGVRWVIPAKANYLKKVTPVLAPKESAALPEEHDRRRLFVGHDHDPVLPHLLAHIDLSSRVDWAVAFVMESGVKRVEGHIRDLLARGGSLRIVTGDYMGITEPRALLRLLDLPGSVDVRVFVSANRTSFHPKGYVFHHSDESGAAFVGSSNLSKSALEGGVEWNYRVLTSRDRRGFEEACDAFLSLFSHPNTVPLTEEWIASYTERRSIHRDAPAFAEVSSAWEPPTPHSVQEEALEALHQTREDGNHAGLVVLATGLGKTWLSAFDSIGFERVLFVAHRDEILTQALRTFRQIRPDAYLGLYTGKQKNKSADVLFASIQTLSRKRHLETFRYDEFDYIIVDEFHHADARSYRAVLQHFEPQFLLGLTATPERTDGGDLLRLCGDNLVFQCDVVEGIRRELLCPFHYFGVPDLVDYQAIPWRSNRFATEELTEKLATLERAQNALEQYQEKAGKRTLAFCCSRGHADFMKEYFTKAAIKAASVHSGAGSDARTTSLEKLARGELDVIFSVDMFNEGLDIPDVDTVMMLRPTESRIIWMQQFGRGLRKAKGKECLTVIDYIGNHRSFLLKPTALFGALHSLYPNRADLRVVLGELDSFQSELPAGCRVTYDLEAITMLEEWLKPTKTLDLFRYLYQDFLSEHGIRPTASEMFALGGNPRSVKADYESWLLFVSAQQGLSPEEEALLQDSSIRAFLFAVETTQLTKSYKMLLLQSMLDAGKVPGAISLVALVSGVARQARRNLRVAQDLGKPVDDEKVLRKHLQRYAIPALCKVVGKGQESFFGLSGEFIDCRLEVPLRLQAAFIGLLQEIIDWRLADYFARSSSKGGFVEGQRKPAKSGQHERELVLWQTYMRADIPPLFGLSFSTGSWYQGYVYKENKIFLLVTLEKDGHPESFQYRDAFLDELTFQWQSQNRTRRESTTGERLSLHREKGIDVHLFVRQCKKQGSRSMPFVYCGEVGFVDWQGEQPITIRWQLAEAVPERLWPRFGMTGV